MLTNTGRLAGLCALSAGLALVAGACSTSGAGQTAPTITIQPQSYQSKPAATLTPQSTTAPTVGEDGRTDQVQRYTVREDEFPAQIASKFGISLDELLEFNDWELNEQGWVPDFPSSGSVIEIPPGARFIDPNEAAEEETTTTEATPGTTDDGATVATTPGTANPEADRCSPGTYTVEAGDYPIGVAQKFDVTIEALNEANAATAGYSTFYPGLEITIPAATDC